MDKMADVLGRAGAWCGQNKYLSDIPRYLYRNKSIDECKSFIFLRV